jgi:hypothetical protein
MTRQSSVKMQPPMGLPSIELSNRENQYSRMTTYYNIPQSARLFRAPLAHRLSLRIQATIGPGPLSPNNDG